MPVSLITYREDERLLMAEALISPLVGGVMGPLFLQMGLLALGSNIFNRGYFTYSVAYPMAYKNILKMVIIYGTSLIASNVPYRIT